MRGLGPTKLSPGQCATLACLFEVSVPKPGNVHRGAAFEDTTYEDFLASAVAIAPAMDSARSVSLGAVILEAVAATRALVAKNTNLGTVLLLAPLAAVPAGTSLREGVADLLRRLTANDAQDVYRAIALARPGGMGHVSRFDIGGPPPDDLLEAMRAAADYDLVARHYVDGFRPLFDEVIPWLRAGLAAGWRPADAIVATHVRLMARYPDSLIGRKCGLAVAEESARRAAEVLSAGGPGERLYSEALASLDGWLRGDGNRRNPGTTADVIAAALFCGLRDGWLPASL